MRATLVRQKSEVPETLQRIVARSFRRLKRGTQDDDLPRDLIRHRIPRYEFHREHDLMFDGIKASKTHHTGVLSTKLEYAPLQVPGQEQVPVLRHKLSRVLFSPGIHYLQDPRTGVFNFNPYLQNILPVGEFDFDAITTFVTASKDTVLTSLAQEHALDYYASTSSMTGVLSHIHFLISNFRPASLLDFSRQHPQAMGSMTHGAKLPAMVIVRKREGCYAIDSDKSCDREILLSQLGHSLERFLTKTPEEYAMYKKTQDRQESIPETNTYHYARMGRFLMRSQLDCYDSRLPGTGTFDLKTRAVAGVRHDLAHVEKNNTNYSLLRTMGEYESYEREMIDLARSTMLKYSLQARIGHMDGIFIAYHNIVNMFGFQYLPLEQMDEIMHSFGLPHEQVLGTQELVRELSGKFANEEFKMSIQLWGELLDMVIKELPDDSFRLIVSAIAISPFETKLRVIASKVSGEEIDELQSCGERLQKTLVDAEEADQNDLVQDHINEISDLNTKLRTELLGFDVYVKSFMNGDASKNRHPVMRSMEDQWAVAVKCVRMPHDMTIDAYDQLLSEKLAMLSKAVAADEEDLSPMVKRFRNVAKKVEDKTNIVWNDD